MASTSTNNARSPASRGPHAEILCSRMNISAPVAEPELETGLVIWLFGYSGAGKSTLADGLAHGLRLETGRDVLRLDGDRLRQGVCSGLGFTDSDRTENLRRAAEIARLGVESGLIVVASFITPREAHRKLVQEIVGASAISFVYVATSLGVCRARDAKGIYRDNGTTPTPSSPENFETPVATAVALHVDSGDIDVRVPLGRLARFVGQMLKRRPSAGSSLSTRVEQGSAPA